MGNPEDRGHGRFFFDNSSSFGSLDAPNNTSSAVVFELTLKDDYCEDSVKFIQETADNLFKQMVEPFLGEVNQLPRELRKTGMFKGKPFDSYKIEVAEVDGQKVLQCIVFSGVDVHGAMEKSAEADMQKLLPNMSFQSTVGYSLGDWGPDGNTPLKDMLQLRYEWNLNW